MLEILFIFSMFCLLLGIAYLLFVCVMFCIYKFLDKGKMSFRQYFKYWEG